MSKSKKQIDLRFIMEVLIYRWKMLMIPLVLAPLTGAIAYHYTPKRFRSSTKIMVQESGVVNPFLSGMMGQWSLKRYLPVIQTILGDEGNLERVLRKLDRIQDNDSSKMIKAKVMGFRTQILAYELGGGLINIDLVGHSPDFVQKGLEELVNSVISEMRRPQKQSVEDATRFLKKELLRIRSELDKAEEDIAKFKREHASELPEFQKANMDVYLTYQKALMEAEIKLQESRRRKRQLEERIKGFKQTEFLSSEHAEYKKAEKEVNSLAANVSLLRSRLDESKTMAKSVAETEKTLTRMRRDVEIKTKVYRNLQERYEDSQVTKALALYDEGNKIWVLQPASLPDFPFSPRMMLILMGSAMGGVLAGLVLVFAAEFLSSTIRREEEVEELTQAPVIGTIPKLFE